MLILASMQMSPIPVKSLGKGHLSIIIVGFYVQGLLFLHVHVPISTL